MLQRIHSQEAYYALEALWCNAYGEMPPKNLNNLDLVNALAADKDQGYRLTDIINYVFNEK
jgi:hypothetical protein